MSEIFSFIALAYYPISLLILLYYAFTYSCKVEETRINVSQIWHMTNDIHSLSKKVEAISQNFDLLTQKMEEK